MSTGEQLRGDEQGAGDVGSEYDATDARSYLEASGGVTVLDEPAPLLFGVAGLHIHDTVDFRGRRNGYAMTVVDLADRETMVDISEETYNHLMNIVVNASPHDPMVAGKPPTATFDEAVVDDMRNLLRKEERKKEQQVMLDRNEEELLKKIGMINEDSESVTAFTIGEPSPIRTASYVDEDDDEEDDRGEDLFSELADDDDDDEDGEAPGL